MRSLVLCVAFASVACTGYYGVRGRVYAPDPSGRREVIVVADGLDDASISDAKPIPGATITCEGCGTATIAVDERGRFYVPADDERPARPVVLHVTAPGCKPASLAITRFGANGSSGLPKIVVVLERAP